MWVQIILKNWKLILSGLALIVILSMVYTIKIQHAKIVELQVENKKMAEDIDIQNKAVNNLKKLGEEMQANVNFASNEIIKLNKQLGKKIVSINTTTLKSVKEFQNAWNDVVTN